MLLCVWKLLILEKHVNDRSNHAHAINSTNLMVPADKKPRLPFGELPSTSERQSSKTSPIRIKKGSNRISSAFPRPGAAFDPAGPPPPLPEVWAAPAFAVPLPGGAAPSPPRAVPSSLFAGGAPFAALSGPEHGVANPK